MPDRPSIEHLRNRYEVREGVLFYRSRFNPRRAGGEPVGHKTKAGYVQVTCQYYRCHAHQIAFAIANGRWADKALDHIDGNPCNNDPSNLREASAAENCRNQKRNSRNTSGVKHVGWNTSRNKWQVQIKAGSRRISRIANTLEEASAIAEKLRKQLHGKFARSE